MANTLRWLLGPSLILGVAACEPEVDVDENETSTGPVVEFDPGNKVIPFPNNLLLDQATGKVNIPASCNESPAAAATRGFVNQLDGFATFEPTLYATFSAMFDPDTLPDRVVLYKRVGSAGPVNPTAATAIPTLLLPLMTVRYNAACGDPQMIPQLIIVPLVPLEQKSVYTAALLSGITTDEGVAFGASFTWSLVRQEAPPVVFDEEGNITENRTPLSPLSPDDIATLQGLNLLYRAHAGALQFLSDKGHERNDVLLAWEFKTQTVTDQLDPSVATSPAAKLGTPVPTGLEELSCPRAAGCPNGIVRAITPWQECTALGAPYDTNDTQCYMAVALGTVAGAPLAQRAAVGSATCAQVGCAAIGEVMKGKLPAKQFQAQIPNAGLPAGEAIPGPWSDPVNPTETVTEDIEFLAFIPVTARPSSTTGYPTVIFGHGLGSTKDSIHAIASQLATPRPSVGNPTGFLTIGIDFVAHSSRAVRMNETAPCVNTDGPAGPGTVPPDPTGAGAPCYAPFLSTNLAGTRDNIRQSVLDLHSLRNMIEGCGAENCDTDFEGFAFNTADVVYAGISLGGIMGSVFTSTRTDVSAAGLNVPGVGWIDILENTATPQIKCPLVDGLIDAGILTGDKSSVGASALCLTDAWKSQAPYRQFSTIGRWLLDGADPANFTSKLATKRIMIQEVTNDAVVPNIATDNEGKLTGLISANMPPIAGACSNPPPPPPAPTAAVLASPMTNKFVKYTDEGPGVCNTVLSPGTTYEHASLLRPAKGHCTMQTTVRCYVSAECAGVVGDTCDGNSVGAGSLATLRLQTDLITWLTINK